MDSNLQTQTDSRNESKKKRVVSLLDYGAGNVRSVRNAIRKLGYEIKDIVQPEDITNAEHLIFPGVGSFGAAMSLLEEKKFLAPLKAYLEADKPFFGICIGMQVLFEASTETGRVTPTQRRALEKQAGGDDGKGGDNDNGADHDASPVYIKGLGVIPGTVEKFTPGVSVPHIGWNGVRLMSKYKDTAVGCDHDGGADNRDVLYRGTQVDNTLKVSDRR